MDKRNNSEGTETSRRTLLKAVGATSLGVAGMNAATTPVAACATYNGCTKDTQTTSYDSISGFTSYLGSSIERVSVTSYDNPERWHHYFKMAGDGSCEENDAKAYEITSQNMFIRNDSTDYLSVFTSKNEKETGFGPEDNGDLGDGSNVVSAATAVLSAAATAVGSSAAGYALSAEQLAEALVRSFDGYDDSGNTYEYVATYNGIARGGHHLNFYVDEYPDGDPYATHDITVRSEFGLARNGWTVSFGDRGVSMSSSSLTTEDYEWGRIDNMSQGEMDHFGVKKVEASQLRAEVRESMDSDSDYYYIAENAPVTTSKIEYDDQN